MGPTRTSGSIRTFPVNSRVIVTTEPSDPLIPTDALALPLGLKHSLTLHVEVRLASPFMQKDWINSGFNSPLLGCRMFICAETVKKPQQAHSLHKTVLKLRTKFLYPKWGLPESLVAYWLVQKKERRLVEAT